MSGVGQKERVSVAGVVHHAEPCACVDQAEKNSEYANRHLRFRKCLPTGNSQSAGKIEDGVGDVKPVGRCRPAAQPPAVRNVDDASSFVADEWRCA